METDEKWVAQFVTVDGEEKGKQVYLPVGTTTEELQIYLNTLLENVTKYPYTIFS